MNSNQYRTERTEMITQADILDRLVAIQDKLYRMENELRSISGTLANMRQDLPFAPAASTDAQQAAEIVVPLQNHTGHPWEEQAP